MKQIILLLTSFLLFATVSYAGEMFYITPQNGVAKVTEKAPFNEALMSGSKDIKLAALSKMGLSFIKFVWEPGAQMGLHTGPEQWIGYTVSGSAKCALGTADNVDSTMVVKGGDVTVWEGNTYHGWVVTSNEPWVSVWFKKD
jgi:quercetin dioxygenase-like cupin family protein